MDAMTTHAKVFPYRKGLAYGNVIWIERDQGSAYYRTSKFAMKNGKFPLSHPIALGGNSVDGTSQCGGGPQITLFRERGYYASCFPEGDGMCWQPLNGQSDEQAMDDLRECFPGLTLEWAP
jgi:hypothetical protein